MRAYLAMFKEEAEKILQENKDKKVVTIECEWGDEEVKGDLALHHHGKNQDNEPPSVFYRWENYQVIKDPVIIFSHLDADAFFGAMWVTGELDPNNSIHTGVSELVALADKKGPHFINPDFKSDVFKKWITIGLIINRNNAYAKGDFTNLLKELFVLVRDVLDTKNINRHPYYLEAKEWYLKIRKNAEKYLQKHYPFVLSFVSTKFMLSNYTLLDEPRPVIVQYNPFLKKLSISVASDEIAKKLFGEDGVVGYLQSKFGKEAGGRVSIGGSPIGVASFKDYNKIKKELRDLTNQKLTKEEVWKLFSLANNV